MDEGFPNRENLRHQGRSNERVGLSSPADLACGVSDDPTCSCLQCVGSPRPICIACSCGGGRMSNQRRDVGAMCDGVPRRLWLCLFPFLCRMEGFPDRLGWRGASVLKGALVSIYPNMPDDPREDIDCDACRWKEPSSAGDG